MIKLSFRLTIGKALLIFAIAISLFQTSWLLTNQFTQIDDIGVAESLLIRNLDYRDDCLKNRTDTRGQLLQKIISDPITLCKITTKLNRLSIIPSLWTYAPLQFWVTQAFLNPHKFYSYDEVKWWGRLPSFLFHLLGIVGFYLLARTRLVEIRSSPLLPLALTALVAFSLEQRIHAGQMHSYAIGLLSNVTILWALLRAQNWRIQSLASLSFSALLLALAIAMQYQAILLVAAGLAALLVVNFSKEEFKRYCLYSSWVLGLTLLFTYSLVGNILGFSGRGTNWNAGPQGEFIVKGEGLFERSIDLARLISTYTPENLYSVTSALVLPSFYPTIFGSLIFIFGIMGFWHLWQARHKAKERYLLLLLIGYGLFYFGLVFLGKLTFSPTRHSLYFLPIIAIVMGYGVLGLQARYAKKWLAVALYCGFIAYLVGSIATYSTFYQQRIDRVSEGFFSQLMRQSKASFLIFNGFDIEPLFMRDLQNNPPFWFSSWGFDCHHTEILIAQNRTLFYLSFSKVERFSENNAALQKYLKDIIGHCTSHTSSNKQIESLRLVKNVVDINDPTSIEFSSRVLSEISLNNMYVQLFEIKTNFDSHQYNASLADGIDFKKAGYPSFLQYVSGIAQKEPWGRWSDAQQGKTIRLGFVDPLPEHFQLEIEAMGYGPNANLPTIVRIGEQEKSLIIGRAAKTYTLEFKNILGADAIEIIPPKPIFTRELDDPSSTDPRKLGLGLMRIKINTEDKKQQKINY